MTAGAPVAPAPAPARARRGRAALRAALRFVASVLITSGVLMLTDAALTLAWQEPVSAFLAQQDQNRLGHELDRATLRLARLDPHALANTRDFPARARGLALAWAHQARKGHAIGRISLPTLHRRYVVVQGTDVDSLREGPGHYPETSFPGAGGTVAIAGHRTTYLAPFHDLSALRAGNPIVLEMPYARLTYAVERVEIVAPDATWIERRVPGAERLVLSACHPLYSASHRIVVFARLARVVPPA